MSDEERRVLPGRTEVFAKQPFYVGFACEHVEAAVREVVDIAEKRTFLFSLDFGWYIGALASNPDAMSAAIKRHFRPKECETCREAVEAMGEFAKIEDEKEREDLG